MSSSGWRTLGLGCCEGYLLRRVSLDSGIKNSLELDNNDSCDSLKVDSNLLFEDLLMSLWFLGKEYVEYGA